LHPWIKTALPLGLLLALCLTLPGFAGGDLYGVSFRGIGEDGTRYFVCESSCGRVRVKKIDHQLYRVYAIGYSGNLTARSEKEAAEKSCGERDISGTKRSPDVADRSGACR